MSCTYHYLQYMLSCSSKQSHLAPLSICRERERGAQVCRFLLATQEQAQLAEVFHFFLYLSTTLLEERHAHPSGIIIPTGKPECGLSSTKKRVAAKTVFVCWSGEPVALEYAPGAPTAGPLQNPYAFTQISEQFILPHHIDPADT